MNVFLLGLLSVGLSFDEDIKANKTPLQRTHSVGRLHNISISFKKAIRKTHKNVEQTNIQIDKKT